MDAGPLPALQIAAKLALYVAALSGGGLALHAALGVIEPTRRRQALGWAAIAAIASLLAGGLRLALTSAQLSGSLNGAFDAASLDWTWRAQGAALVAAALGAAAMAMAWGLRSRWAAALGAILLAASFGLTGHAQGLETPGAAPFAVGAHVLIASFWVTAPLSLWPRSGLSDAELAARMRGFTRIAAPIVPVLFALGLWLAWRLAGGFAPLLTSLYGQLVTAKLAAAAMALGLGVFNKQVVTQQIEAAPLRGRALLRGALLADIILFLTAMALIDLATTVTGPPE